MAYNLLLNGVCWGYNPLILTFGPNFLGHPSSHPHKTAGTKGQYRNFWYRQYSTRLGDSSFDWSPLQPTLWPHWMGIPMVEVFLWQLCHMSMCPSMQPLKKFSKHANFCLAKQSLLKSGLTGNSKANVFTYHGGTKMMVCAANALPHPQVSKICRSWSQEGWSVQFTIAHFSPLILSKSIGCTPWTWVCPAML